MRCFMKKKRIDLEILRIIAALLVIFNHSNGFLLFNQYKSSSVLYWMYLFISILCAVAVPLFFTISGVLLLKKDDDTKTLLKRIIRIIIVLIVISVLYFVFNYHDDKSNFNLICFIKLFYSKNTEFHLWFLYQYIAFLLILPILRALIKGIGDNKKFLNI